MARSTKVAKVPQGFLKPWGDAGFVLSRRWRWWCRGKLKPLIAKSFPLVEAGAAFNALLSRRYAGKVVLET